MKSRIKTGILKAARAGLFTIFALTAESARAAVPELINFQGKLTDSAGTAITTSVPMVFKFYTTATGGSLVWTENQDVVPDDTGLYSVLLGSATSFSTYGISFSTAYWLGVTVGTDLEMTPRYKIVSSAYALYSINSGTAAYSVNSGTSAWANGVDWPMVNHKPVFADVYLASTQTFTGSNTFLSTAAFTALDPSLPGVTISSGLVVSAGTVRVGTMMAPSNLTIIGTFLLADGSAAAGRVLTSDANGLANWQVAGGGGGDVYKASTQTFTGVNTFMANTYFSSSVYLTNGGIYSTGTVGGVPFSGAGTRLMWMPEKFAIRAGGVTALQWNSNNIGNYSVAFGLNNMANGSKAVVAGGELNTASGSVAVVAGGYINEANNQYSTVAGGYGNTASGLGAGVAGGGNNLASGSHASVAGGVNNIAAGDYATVAGGENNTASGSAATASGSFNVATGMYATVAGGRLNIADTYAATVSGGQNNKANMLYATVPGGVDNTANGIYSFAAGRASSSTADGAFTWADSQGTVVDNNVVDRTWFKSSGGFLVTASTNPADGGMFLNDSNYVGIGTIVPTSTLTVIGTFKLADGSQGSGKVLTSDAVGLAAWAAPAGPVYAVTQADNINGTPTLADIPMLSITLIANATYQFEAELSCGAAPVVVGLQYAVAYPVAGATVEAVIYGPVSSAAMKNSRITAINTATSNYLTESALTGGILIKGIITTSSSGNLTIQHAAPNPNSSTVYKGSYLKVTKL